MIVQVFGSWCTPNSRQRKIGAIDYRRRLLPVDRERRDDPLELERLDVPVELGRLDVPVLRVRVVVLLELDRVEVRLDVDERLVVLVRLELDRPAAGRERDAVVRLEPDRRGGVYG